MARPSKTTREQETAIKVLTESKMVKNWAVGELKAFGLDPGSAVGRKFLEEKTVEIARRLVR